MLQYIETNKSLQICVYVWRVFLRYVRVRKCREVCCRSLYCITLCRFVQGINFKITQISICTYLQRWEENVSRMRIAGEKKVPLLLLKLLPLFLSLFSWLWFSLCFCWSINTAHNRRSAQMCVNVTLHVLLLTVLICDAANCCALLGSFFFLVQKMNQNPCIGCYGERKQICLRLFFTFMYDLFYV